LRLKLLLISVSVVFALLVSEITLRALNFRPGTMDPRMYIANADPLLPFKLQPDYHGYCSGHVTNTDHDGNRIITPSYGDIRKGRQPNRTILLVGDSGVFGFGVADNETIGSQMQRIALEKNLNYEVRNIGVCGYTSWNEYKAISNYLEKQSATDLVLLYMPNDLTLDNDYFGIGRGQQASFARGEDTLHRLTRELYSSVYVSYLVSDGLKRITSRLKHQAEAMIFDEQRMQPQIDYSMQALEKIQELSKARNVSFSVGIYRDVAYFEDPQGWMKYEAVIERNLERHQIRWFVTKSHIENLTAGQIRSSWNDPHPSPQAISFIVNDILQQLN